MKGPPMPQERQAWHCIDCGRRFSHWAQAQRHANESGHVRLEIVLPGAS